MPSQRNPFCMATAMLFAVSSAIAIAGPAESPAPVFTSIPALAFDTSGPVLRARTEAQKPFTVAGERGVLLGQQDGSFEAWLLPIKLLSHLTIEANIEGYTVPIDLNQQAAEIEVRPDRTIITYSHIGFTVWQIMFSPNAAPPRHRLEDHHLYPDLVGLVSRSERRDQSAIVTRLERPSNVIVQFRRMSLPIKIA